MKQSQNLEQLSIDLQKSPEAPLNEEKAGNKTNQQFKAELKQVDLARLSVNLTIPDSTITNDTLTELRLKKESILDKINKANFFSKIFLRKKIYDLNKEIEKADSAYYEALQKTMETREVLDLAMKNQKSNIDALESDNNQTILTESQNHSQSTENKKKVKGNPEFPITNLSKKFIEYIDNFFNQNSKPQQNVARESFDKDWLAFKVNFNNKLQSFDHKPISQDKQNEQLLMFLDAYLIDKYEEEADYNIIAGNLLLIKSISENHGIITSELREKFIEFAMEAPPQDESKFLKLRSESYKYLSGNQATISSFNSAKKQFEIKVDKTNPEQLELCNVFIPKIEKNILSFYEKQGKKILEVLNRYLELIKKTPQSYEDITQKYQYYKLEPEGLESFKKNTTENKDKLTIDIVSFCDEAQQYDENDLKFFNAIAKKLQIDVPEDYNWSQPTNDEYEKFSSFWDYQQKITVSNSRNISVVKDPNETFDFDKPNDGLGAIKYLFAVAVEKENIAENLNNSADDEQPLTFKQKIDLFSISKNSEPSIQSDKINENEDKDSNKIAIIEMLKYYEGHKRIEGKLRDLGYLEIVGIAVENKIKEVQKLIDDGKPVLTKEEQKKINIFLRQEDRDLYESVKQKSKRYIEDLFIKTKGSLNKPNGPNTSKTQWNWINEGNKGDDLTISFDSSLGSSFDSPFDEETIPANSVSKSDSFNSDSPNTSAHKTVAINLSLINPQSPGEAFAKNEVRGNSFRVADAYTDNDKKTNQAEFETMRDVMVAIVKLVSKEVKIDLKKAIAIIEFAEENGGVSHTYNSEKDSYSKAKNEQENLTNFDILDQPIFEMSDAKKFSKIFQKKCQEYVIYSGRTTKLKNPLVGMRTAFVPKEVLQALELRITQETLLEDHQRNDQEEKERALLENKKAQVSKIISDSNVLF